MSIAIPRKLFICGSCVALMAGCTLSSPPAAPAPAPVGKDSTSVTAVTKSWKPSREVGNWRYELHSSASVTLTTDTLASSLPVDRTTIYTVTIAPTAKPAGNGAMFEVTGSVDSVAVTTPERIPSPTAGSNIRPHFRAELARDGSLSALTSNATTACRDAIDPLSAAVVTLFVTLPPEVSLGTNWSDTLSTVTCRGRMPVITTAIRHYSVVTDTLLGNAEALLITRVDSVHIENRPDTTSDQMMAAGTGHASYTLYVDPRSGMLLSATGQSHTEITVLTSSSRFPFREDARQTIALVR